MGIGTEGQIIEIAHEVRCLSIRLALREIIFDDYQQEFDRLLNSYQAFNAARGSAFRLMDEELS